MYSSKEKPEIHRSKLSIYGSAIAFIFTILFSTNAWSETIAGRLLVNWGDTQAGDYTVSVVLVPSFGGKNLSLYISDQLIENSGGYGAINGALVEIETAQVSSAAFSLFDRTVSALSIKSLTQNSRLAAVSNSRIYTSIMCKFAGNASEPQGLTYFQDMYGNSPGMLNHYWKEASSNVFNIDGSTAYGWFTLPFTSAYYKSLVVGDPDDFNSNSSSMLDKLHEDCINAADAVVDFSAVDGVNLMFNDTIGCCAWGGSAPYQVDGLSGFLPTTWEPPWGWGNQSTMVHEMGHSLGLPHSNNFDRDGFPYDNPWTPMSDAYQFTVLDQTYGIRGKHINAFEKYTLGWLQPSETFNYTSGSATINLDPLNYAFAGANAYRTAIIPVNSAEIDYYMIEVRTNGGEGGGYDANLPGNAVVIYAVEESRREPSWIVDGDNPVADFSSTEGVMWRVGEVYEDTANNIRVSVDYKTNSQYTVSISGIDSEAPNTVIVTPGNGGPELDASIAITFSGNATDTGASGFSAVRVRILNLGTGQFETLSNGSDSIAATLTKPFNLNNTNWNYSQALNPGSYRLMVRTIDKASNASPWATREFSVIAPDVFSPKATIVSPEPTVVTGAVIFAGNATDTGGSGFAAVRLRVRDEGTGQFLVLKNGTSTISAVLSKPGNKNNTNWTASQSLTAGSYRLFVKAIDQAGNQQPWVKRDFVVQSAPDNLAPVAIIVSPTGGSAIDASANFVISGNATDTGGSGFSAVRLRILNTGSGQWEIFPNGSIVANSILSKPNNKNNTNWKYIHSLPGGSYRLFAAAVDKAGNQQSWVKQNFSVQ